MRASKRCFKMTDNVLFSVIAVVLITALALVSWRRVSRCVVAIAGYLRGYPIDETEIQLPPYTGSNTVKLLVNGNEILPVMLDLIADSRSTIRFQVMLFHPDEAGKAVASALAEAARRGVEVQLSFDIGQTTKGPLFLRYSREQTKERQQDISDLLHDLRQAGVAVMDNPTGTYFGAKNLSQQAAEVQREILESTCVGMNHADHRKIIIVDGRMAIIGGTNVGNEYLYRMPPDFGQRMDLEAVSRRESGLEESWEKWLDTAVMLKGPAVRQLVEEFNNRWEIIGGKPIPAESVPSGEGDVSVQVLSQRPGNEQIASSYLTLIREAQESIFISSPYVSYGPALQLLMQAASRGVRIVFVFPGDYNDVPISPRIFRSFTPGLLSAGVQVYENNERMIHSKVMVVDNRWTTIGSFNFDHRSFNHDFEQNLVIDEADFASEVIERLFEKYMTISTLLPEPYTRRLNLFERLILPFS